MSRTTGDEDEARWHRRFAAEANNRAWDLSEQPRRTAAEDDEMLRAAHASAHHWARVGTEVESGAAELLLARVHAVLGHAAAAGEHARRYHAHLAGREGAAWEHAFAWAALAHAAALAGDATAHAEAYARAREFEAAIADDDERRLFAAAFRRVPEP